MPPRPAPPGEEPAAARKVYVGDTTCAQDIISREFRGWWRDDRAEEDEWVAMPEVPSSEETTKPTLSSVAQSEKNWDDYKEDPIYDPSLPKNIVDGPWPSKNEYLETHYRLIREDAIASLRTAVAKVKEFPHMDDDRETRIYTQVFMAGILLSRSGPAIRITFSTDRAGKQIRWAQSTRLMQGSIVALSPATDNFSTICRVAIIAARPVMGALDQNPPMVDLFWENMDGLQLDSTKEWIMVESRQGFFEATRHVLLSLQKARTEKFPLSRQVVSVIKHPMPPRYIQDNPWVDLTPLEMPMKPGHENTLVEAVDDTDYSRVNVLRDFPEDILNGMDKSQLLACKSMLTQRVAIIQGPPGTGKTFVSVAGLKVMIHNLGPYDPPIIVAAQTNHALDQLLNHILEFESKIVRLGGRCDKKNKEIIERTLFELREANREVPEIRVGRAGCFREHKAICKEIKDILQPLKKGGLLTSETLLEHGILTERHVHSLKRAIKGKEPGTWPDDDDSDESDGGDEAKTGTASEIQVDGDIGEWLGKEQTVFAAKTLPANLGLPLEEIDLEYEQLQSLEEEAAALRDEDEIQALTGEWIPFGHRQTTRFKQDVSLRKVVQELRNLKDMYNVPLNKRAQLYQGIEKIFMETLHNKLKPVLTRYRKLIDDFQVFKAVNNYKLIKMLGTKVVGCTTTGLAKYRPLIAALKPRTLLIEEAAETLEAMVTAGMVPSLEQLILVGDHKQLHASCNVRELEGAPYHLSMSMFERLVNNNLPYTMLNTQRRMITKIRELLSIEPDPFYKDLKDHPSVLDRDYNRQLIPGMGGRDVYFFQHEWPEAVNSDASRYNASEAEMIAGFFNHLVLNGTEATRITVLTFYNGQRKEILRQLKKHERLKRAYDYFNVFTVDSYQGEENDVILLSLVRSNRHHQVGFLDTKNRVVVALSRARRGMYLFGNAVTLTCNEKTDEDDMIARDPLWKPIFKHMANNKPAQMNIDRGLPITCKNHKRTEYLRDPSDWAPLAGGCSQPCGGVLTCGHPCVLMCHPFEHELLQCGAPCKLILDCGHGCSNNCGQVCHCDACNPIPEYDLGEQEDIRELPTWQDDQADARLAGESTCRQELPIRGVSNHGPSRPVAPKGSSSFSLGSNERGHAQDIHCQTGMDRSSSHDFDDGEYVLSRSRDSPYQLAPIHRRGINIAQSGPTHQNQPEADTRLLARDLIEGHRGQLSPDGNRALKAWQNFNPKEEDARLGKLAEVKKADAKPINQSAGVVWDNYVEINVNDSGRVKDSPKKDRVKYGGLNDQKEAEQSEKLIDI